MHYRLMTLAASAMMGIAIIATPATAQSVGSICKDGSSSAAAGRGACSGHGGVDGKATSAAKKAAKKAIDEQKKAAKESEKAQRDAEKAQRETEKRTRENDSRVARTPLPRSAPERPRSVPKPSVTNPSSRRSEDTDPTGAIAQCRDGLYSHAANHRGACSKHGGVSKFLR